MYDENLELFGDLLIDALRTQTGINNCVIGYLLT